MVEQKSGTYGSTYRYIRQAKNLSQQTVTRKNISRSSLSKFEHNKQTIYLDNFLKLLKELELSVSEFLFINNDYQFEVSDHLRDRFYKTHFTGDISYFEDLSQRIGEYLEVEDDWCLGVMKDYLDVLINVQADTTGEQADKLEALAVEIWEEINRYEEWFVNDLRLLNVIIYHLPREIVDSAIERMERRILDYNAADDLQIMVPSFQLNVSFVYIKYGLMERAAEFAQAALASVQKNRRYDFYVVGLIRKGTALKDFELIHRALRLADELADTQISQLMHIEVIKNIPMHFTKYPNDMEQMNWQADGVSDSGVSGIGMSDIDGSSSGVSSGPGVSGSGESDIGASGASRASRIGDMRAGSADEVSETDRASEANKISKTSKAGKAKAETELPTYNFNGYFWFPI